MYLRLRSAKFVTKPLASQLSVCQGHFDGRALLQEDISRRAQGETTKINKAFAWHIGERPVHFAIHMYCFQEIIVVDDGSDPPLESLFKKDEKRLDQESLRFGSSEEHAIATRI